MSAPQDDKSPLIVPRTIFALLDPVEQAVVRIMATDGRAVIQEAGG